jgi:hypothetical protein
VTVKAVAAKAKKSVREKLEDTKDIEVIEVTGDIKVIRDTGDIEDTRVRKVQLDQQGILG